MSEQAGREWRFYIDDMIAFIEKIAKYTEGLDQHAFVSCALTYDATLRNLKLTGEAATRIPNEVRNTKYTHCLATNHRYAKSIDPRLPRHRR